MNVIDWISKLQQRSPKIMGSGEFSQYGILVPLVKLKGEYHVLFEVRSSSLRRQPGEICFPGGKIEKTGETGKEAAIRETSEELGIPENHIHPVTSLDYIVSAFGSRIIYPYAGIIQGLEELKINEAEVEEIFTVPLSELLEMEPECYKIDFQISPEETFPYHLINGGKNYKWQTRQADEYFYYHGNHVIWGLTAGILKHFLELIKEISAEPTS